MSSDSDTFTSYSQGSIHSDDDTALDIRKPEDPPIFKMFCSDTCGKFLLFLLVVTGVALGFWVSLGSIYTNLLRTSSALLCFGQLGSTWRYMGPTMLIFFVFTLLWILRLFMIKTSSASMRNGLHSIILLIIILIFTLCNVTYILTETGMVIQHTNTSMYRCEFGEGRTTASLAFASIHDANLSESNIECEFWSASAFCSEPFGYLATLFESQKINGTSGVYICKSAGLDGLKLCFTYDSSLAISGWMSLAGIVFSLCLLLFYSLVVMRLNRALHECCPSCSPPEVYIPLKTDTNSPLNPTHTGAL